MATDSSNQLMPLSLTAPGVNLGAYISTVNQIPILTPEQEKELADRYYYDQDLDAAKMLVMSHLRFVIHIARSYAGYGLPQGDLIQEGNLGLMKAVKRFDPTMGVRLVSFAVHWIKAEIHEYVIRNWRIVKVATTKAQRKLFFNLRSLKKSSKKLTLEEAQAIANDLNVTPDKMMMTMKVITLRLHYILRTIVTTLPALQKKKTGKRKVTTRYMMRWNSSMIVHVVFCNVVG